MKIKYLFILLLLFCFSCKNKTEISLNLNQYEKFEFKDERIYLIMIKSYKNENKCNSSVKNANLYLCQMTETNDTILIIEPCSKMPDFTKNNQEEEKLLSLEKEDILNINFQKVNIIVDDSILLKKKYKYAVGSLTYLVY